MGGWGGEAFTAYLGPQVGHVLTESRKHALISTKYSSVPGSLPGIVSKKWIANRRFPISPWCLGFELSPPRPVCLSTLSLSGLPTFQDNFLAGVCDPESGSPCICCIGMHRSADLSVCDAISLYSLTQR